MTVSGNSRRWALLLCVAALSGIAFAQAPVQGDAERKSRAQWFLRGRAVAGESAAALRYRAYWQKLQMRAHISGIRSRTALPDSPWTSLGPAPLASDASGVGQQDYGWVSGRATSVVIDRADASGNTVYAGGAYGGLWKSSNAGSLSQDPAGVVWTPLLDEQPTLAVGSIAIQPPAANPDLNHRLILVGTGEPDSSTDSYYGLGIFRSTDAGSSWTLITQDSSQAHSFAGLGFSKIAFSTSNPNLVVAAAAGTSQGELSGLQNPVSVNLGLYYSTDAGSSWNHIISHDGPAAVNPASATSVVFNPLAGKFFAALRFHGFYVSSDGVTWTRMTNQPGNAISTSACPASPTAQNCPLYRGELAVVDGRNEMYAWFVDADNRDQGIWKTTDGGATPWTQVNDVGITNCGDLIGGCGTENGSYNLALAAVPDGGDGTDLYAGAVNLFKCTVTGTFPHCDPASGQPDATFLNLTHVYGCPPNLGSIAHVHPGQHGIDFMVAGGRAVGYFANDGGIYRALDGYSGLTSGDCANPNQFDSLNQTLGSMTQFVSLAQDPTDANIVLGGTQGNGSPATATARTSTEWTSVNSADGGYSEINPQNPGEWFTANTGVSIQRCTSGNGCHSSDFNNDLVVSNGTLGGDSGGLYVPYILDPQDSGTLIVGTCRVWRGATSGIGFSVLSNNFETLTSAGCTGDEVNTVRSLAAGGTKDANGFSSVIYAGTDGTGPLAATPAGGRVWAMTTAGDGSAYWSDTTSGINAQHVPISGIALDDSDATGNTAFISVMGFHNPHVWKTTNAGALWTDFTGNLPDAPADAILVDGDTVFVGTDVGVFASSTASANWGEVGPAGGQSGVLPNVPVTALRMFDNGATKLLRAATYGRGAWEFAISTVPDFFITAESPTQTVFASQSATYRGKLNALDGYAESVTLSCTGSPPAVCGTSPASVTASVNGDFTLSASGGVGDYAFAIHGAGGDGTLHDSPVTLHVIDFTLGAPSPQNVPVALDQSSTPVSLTVDFAGSFPAGKTVSLSCNAPASLTCSFFPKALISPSLGNPAAVTLTVAASPDAAPGTATVTITATGTSDAGPQTLSQPLSVTVTSTQDYSISLSPQSSTLFAGQIATLQGLVTGVNGYNAQVQLFCVNGGTAPPLGCTPTPQGVTASSGGAAFVVTASNTTAGGFSFNVQGVGTDPASLTRSTPVTVNFFGFTATPVASVLSVVAGQTASFSLDVATIPSNVAFPANLTYSCTGLPAQFHCSFSPSQMPAGSGKTTVTLTLTTDAATPPGAYAVTVTSQCGPLSKNLTLTVNVGSDPGFTVTNVSGSQTVTAGAMANYALQFAPKGEDTFANNVTYTCDASGIPVAVCSLAPPAPIAAGSSKVSVTVSVKTSSTSAELLPASQGSLARFAALWLPLPAFLLVLGNRRRSRWNAIAGIAVTMVVLVLFVNCGGGLTGGSTATGSPTPTQVGTPAGTYNITVNATSGSVSNSVQLALTVTR